MRAQLSCVACLCAPRKSGAEGGGLEHVGARFWDTRHDSPRQIDAAGYRTGVPSRRATDLTCGLRPRGAAMPPYSSTRGRTISPRASLLFPFRHRGLGRGAGFAWRRGYPHYLPRRLHGGAVSFGARDSSTTSILEVSPPPTATEPPNLCRLTAALRSCGLSLADIAIEHGGQGLTLPMEFALDPDRTILGTAFTPAGEEVLALTERDRMQHMLVLGKTGRGKTTLLENIIVQDIYAGLGVGVIDPHGDLSRALLDHIPSFVLGTSCTSIRQMKSASLPSIWSRACRATASRS